MKLDFLGDAFDHWKGSLIESLSKAHILRNFAVDLMVTDGDWRNEDFQLYARLLRVAQGQLLEHRVTLTEREKYFNEIQHPGDLFLDSDTGVATGTAKKQHVKACEIGQLLDRGPSDRLLVIYQAVRGKVEPRVKEVVNALKKPNVVLTGCSYESNTAAMLFLSRIATRSDQVADHFDALLKPRAGNRIRRFPGDQ